MSFFSRYLILGVFFLSLSETLALPSNSHLGPTASFTVTPTNIPLAAEIHFDASRSHDARGNSNLDFRWKFSQTLDFTAWSKQKTATQTFTKTGPHEIRLQVRDRDGLIDETKTQIYVKAGNLKPQARFFVKPLHGDPSTNFHFRVEVASFSATPADLLEIRFDFNRDGTFDTQWSTSRDFFHTFDQVGTKEVWLEVRDGQFTTLEKGYYVTGQEDDGRRDKVIGRLTVAKTNYPRASLKVSQTQITPKTLLSFDATKSKNAQFFRFDFDGDGNFDTEWSKAAKANFAFQRAGNFASILEIKNSAGLFDRATVQIAVLDTANIPPIADFTVRNQTNASLGGELGVVLDKFSFDAGPARDPDGQHSAIQVRWDFDGDNIFDTTFSSKKSAQHSFYRTGNFEPKLEILDERGTRATKTKKLKIIINTPPQARLKVTPTTGTPATEFRFDAFGSTDHQTGTRNLAFRFDFENDGVFDTKFQNSSFARRKFATPGLRTARVEVRDHAQTVGSALAEFEVFTPQKPQVALTVTPAVGTFATNFQFDASASTGPSPKEKLRFQWDFDYHGPTDLQRSTGLSTNPRTTRRFTETGRQKVCVFVQNSAQIESQTCRQFLVHPASPFLAYLSARQILRNERIDEPITRREFAQLLSLATNLRPGYLRQQQFSDVPKEAKFASAMSVAVKRGWLQMGANFTFNPEAPVQQRIAFRALLAALYPKVAEFQPGSATFFSPQDPAARFFSVAAREKLLAEFNPDHYLTRAEAAEITAKLRQKYW